MWELRKKRLRQRLVKRGLELPKEDEEEITYPQPVFPKIPQKKLEEINLLAKKYLDSPVRLTIRAKDLDKLTEELLALRDEVIRLRVCVEEKTDSFANDNTLDLESNIEIDNLDDYEC